MPENTDVKSYIPVDVLEMHMSPWGEAELP